MQNAAKSTIRVALLSFAERAKKHAKGVRSSG